SSGRRGLARDRARGKREWNEKARQNSRESCEECAQSLLRSAGRGRIAAAHCVPSVDVLVVRNSVTRGHRAERSEERVVCPINYTIVAKLLDTGFRFVGPFQLHDVAAESFGFPGADVADFSV